MEDLPQTPYDEQTAVTTTASLGGIIGGQEAEESLQTQDKLESLQITVFLRKHSKTVRAKGSTLISMKSFPYCLHILEWRNCYRLRKLHSEAFLMT